MWVLRPSGQPQDVRYADDKKYDGESMDTPLASYNAMDIPLASYNSIGIPLPASGHADDTHPK
jgi:hypothetical protein